MSRREIAFMDEGTEAYCRMVEEMVRENFDALDTSGSEEGGRGSQREAVEATLKESLDLDELEAGFKQADELLEGFWQIGHAVDNTVLQIVIGDARERERDALERVQEFRATWG
jgi:hypothetical protein